MSKTVISIDGKAVLKKTVVLRRIKKDLEENNALFKKLPINKQNSYSSGETTNALKTSTQQLEEINATICTLIDNTIDFLDKAVEKYDYEDWKIAKKIKND